jgi:hypothetical protein
MTRFEIIQQQVRNGTYRVNVAGLAEALQDRLVTLAIANPEFVLIDATED